jgi:serine/threonine protein kinase
MSRDHLDHYELIETVGSGGGGCVWKARDTRLGREVAIKVLTPGTSLDPDRRKRFFREAKAASNLNHPNIVTIHEMNSSGGRDYIVMEFVRGVPLSKLIPAQGMELGQLLRIAIQIADALATAHASGVVHRDIKPSNVMVDREDRVKILDFGLAKLMKDSPLHADEEPRGEAPHTVHGLIVGTVSYMSPELALGLEVDARSDIFSFGSLLFEMVSGKKPFTVKATWLPCGRSVLRRRRIPPRCAPASLWRCAAWSPVCSNETPTSATSGWLPPPTISAGSSAREAYRRPASR